MIFAIHQILEHINHSKIHCELPANHVLWPPLYFIYPKVPESLSDCQKVISEYKSENMAESMDKTILKFKEIGRIFNL